MKIIFETHSASLDNEEGKASGWHDVDLSETGMRQAQELGERYRETLPQAVYCSDLLRSYRTGAIAFVGTGTPLIIDKRLREWDYGAFSLKSRQEIDHAKGQYIETPFPGGESYRDASKRLLSLLTELRESSYDKIMIIGHRATQYALEEHLKRNKPEVVLRQKFVWQPGWQYNMHII